MPLMCRLFGHRWMGNPVFPDNAAEIQAQIGCIRGWMVRYPTSTCQRCGLTESH